MTAPVKYEVIDKLMVTLLSADDTNAIVAAQSAVKRKLDASKLDIHNLVLRPPQDASKGMNEKTVAFARRVEELNRKVEERDAEIERLKSHADDPDVMAMISAAIKVDRRNAFKESEALEAKLKLAEDRAGVAEAKAEELLARAEVAEAIVATVRGAVA